TCALPIFPRLHSPSEPPSASVRCLGKSAGLPIDPASPAGAPPGKPRGFPLLVSAGPDDKWLLDPLFGRCNRESPSRSDPPGHPPVVHTEHGLLLRSRL